MLFVPFSVHSTPYHLISITIRLSLKFMGYLVDMSSNPMKMHFICVSQYLYEKWLLPQCGIQYKNLLKLGIYYLKYKLYHLNQH